jgi:copper chaperone
MDHTNFKFKTTINCGGCEAKVKPHLDGLISVLNWTVDTADKRKVLSVKSSEMQPDSIIEAVRAAGFRIELLRDGEE